MTRIKCPKCGHICSEGQAVCAKCDATLPRVRVTGSQARQGASPTPVTGRLTTLKRGQTLADRYTVIEVIGRGGMGCIYRVRDETLGEHVALKTLLPQFVQNKVVVERFFNEARIARHLSHPNIIRVHDIGLAGDVIYISMELLEGDSLRGVLDALPAGEYLPIETALQIMGDLCAALEYAHQQTIHRDIKPENVMIAPDGSVKLMDFGISKLMSSMHLTAASMVMGTPMYMSPEQLKDSRDVDARADVFSVGVVLYELLTGNLPTGIPKPASQVRRGAPPELDAIVQKCVEPNREHRYNTAIELRDALLRVPVRSGHQTITTPAPRAGGRARWRVAAGLALIGLLVVLTGWGIWRVERMWPAEVVAPPKDVTLPDREAPRPDALEMQSAHIVEVVERARAQADLAAEGDDEKQKTIELAERRWNFAQDEAAQKKPGAVAAGIAALQCFVAVKQWPEGMVFVPPGETTLTDATGTGPVTLGAFFIDRTEGTNEQFRRFCEATNWRRPPGVAFQDFAQFPVTMVRFYDAQAFAAHCGRRLPTEAQWVRAASGGQGVAQAFPWGDTWEAGFANVGSADGEPAPVNSFPEDRSPFGCVDMVGNVQEWTRSEYRRLPYDPADGREHPGRLYFGSSVAVRGGHFKVASASAPPLSARYSATYESFGASLGFRCVLELPTDLEGLEALL